MSEPTADPSAAIDRARPARRLRWIRKSTLEDRQAMRTTVFGNGTRYGGFTFMLILSVTIAVMGCRWDRRPW
jgi:hypothetical protein